MSDKSNPYKAPQSEPSKPEITIPEGEKYTPLMLEHLKNTRPWVLFLAIVFIVGCAFMVLAGLGMLAGGAMVGANNPAYRELQSRGMPIFIISGLLYIIFAGVYIPIIVFLFRYANSIKGLLTTGLTASIEEALGHQKSFWKYVGILTIVGLAFLVLAIVVGIIISIASMSSAF
ncbi:MAG: hypothetical protein JW822_06095 [Spirochaetales bacterium]|nr:hypothetical protein [Spirochaetales bacterium]